MRGNWRGGLELDWDLEHEAKQSLRIREEREEGQEKRRREGEKEE